MPVLLNLSQDKPVVDYFKEFKGLDAVRFNPKGFWDLPIPVASDVEVHPDDIVIYDGEGYSALKQNLEDHGIRHVLLLGYATDICFAHTCAGFENLAKDFNVFLVGDATLSSFPASNTPRLNTSAHICSASLDHLITQISWIRFEAAKNRVSRK
jgi:nicotinamidase-related amidase